MLAENAGALSEQATYSQINLFIDQKVKEEALFVRTIAQSSREPPILRVNCPITQKEMCFFAVR